MTIKLPPKFNDLLTGEYRAFVENSIARYKEVYINNKLEFFPDFTDHGIRHIEEVLETAENIIEEVSFKFLNEKDICVLIVAVLLHDIGMHISREGVKKIMDPSFDIWRNKFFDDCTWHQEWVSYFQEAKRFNDDQLKNIFGTTQQNINEPNLDNLDNYTIKLYGEFIRRHHHRLAHEIAMGGFPSKIGNENIITPSGDIEPDILDISGLVARSHGMKVRTALDYLENKFQDAWRAPYNVKAVFLMVVLRIADYIQIHSGRASKVVLKSKTLDSPISRKEWEKHNSIKDINVKTADPERIFVIAKPENSVIYLELVKLFEDIQAELDISWAILGEAYGKDDELKNLKIRFRRIRSVLDDIESFSSTVNYIPEKVFFNADPSLLKLLIGPLYGEDPQYGIRELLQNAVDAVKEREYLYGEQGKIRISLQPVKKGKPRYELTIQDSGIGMSKETLIHYFFKAGASFRKSMTWKKNFIDDNEVKIQKTGRFGVGVLAVFLLGDEFELFTKYDSKSSQGYYCKASLSMTQVELQKKDCEVGTMIKIILKENVNSIINSTLKDLNEKIQIGLHIDIERDLLHWFTWYVMDRPKIEYNIDENLQKIFRPINPAMLISSIPDTPLNQWRGFTTEEYRSIQWTIDLKNRSDYTYYNNERHFNDTYENLICNGFKIRKGYKFNAENYLFKKPKVSVFDNNANFPLSLSRDHIQEDILPFEEELCEHICIEIINTVLSSSFISAGPYYYAMPNYLNLYGQLNISDFLVVIGDEYTVLEQSIFSILKIQDFYQFWIKLGAGNNFNFLPGTAYQLSLITKDSITLYKQILDASTYDFDKYFNWINLGLHLDRNDPLTKYYLSKSKLKHLYQRKRLSQSFKDAHNQVDINETWAQIYRGDSKLFVNEPDFSNIDCDLYSLIAKRYIKSSFNNSNIFIKTWLKYLGNEWTFPIEKSQRPEFLKFRKTSFQAKATI